MWHYCLIEFKPGTLTRNTSLTSACESSLLNISSWRKPIWVNAPPLRAIVKGPVPVDVPTVPPNRGNATVRA